MSLTQAPLVTLGITCFNAEDTIGAAIASAANQTWPNIEIVIVDDRSTDNSVDVVKNSILSIPNVRLLQHAANAGPGASRNSVLGAARGEFVAFFDDDDISYPGRIATQVQHLQNYEKRHGVCLVACVASGIRRYRNGYEIQLPAIGSRGEAPRGPEAADYFLYFRRRADWDYGGAVPACALLARRSTFSAVGDFDAQLRRVEDNDFAIRLALAGGHFTGPPEILYVQHSTNAPDKSPEKNLAAEQRVVTKYKYYLMGQHRYYYALHWHKMRYWHFRRNYMMVAMEFLGIFVRAPISSTLHFLTTGPRRVLHELRMRKRADE